MKIDDLKKIEVATVERYSKRFEVHGDSPKSLGWGSKKDQLIRFKQIALSNLDFKEKSIIDIGCGFGDFLEFLIKNNYQFKNYIGVDINNDLITFAKNKFKNTKKTAFKRHNILEDSLKNKSVANIGIMIGLLNFKLKDKSANQEYSRLMIEKAFSLVSDYLIIDFLSAEKCKSYKGDNWTFHHDLTFVTKIALSLTNNFIIKHDYPEIPQKEFMLVLKK